MDKQGNFLIADESGRIIELTAANVLYDLAGAANVSGYAEGSGTAAKFSNPQGICITPSGNIFVSDFNNNRIRKVVIVTSGGTQ
jgi:streptogramin lyase